MKNRRTLLEEQIFYLRQKQQCAYQQSQLQQYKERLHTIVEAHEAYVATFKKQCKSLESKESYGDIADQTRHRQEAIDDRYEKQAQAFKQRFAQIQACEADLEQTYNHVTAEYESISRILMEVEEHECIK